MPKGDFAARVRAVRRFSRFYTVQIGILNEGYLESPFSLIQVRVLYELAHRKQPIARELCRDLRIDPGYLSRILRGFERQRLIDRKTSERDGRQSLLSLTKRGQRVFANLDQHSATDIGRVLGGLAPPDQQRLVRAMDTIEALLAPPPATASEYTLRSHRPGDLGWIVQRHGAIYAQEYGWNQEFEGLVASIVARFAQQEDPRRERCWIAERNGEPLGCVLLMRRSETIARLRLLLVEPQARGLGIGRRLVAECVAFARSTGYRRIVLWTNNVLVSARRIYEAAGFELTEEKKHHSFGKDLVGQMWELKL